MYGGGGGALYQAQPDQHPAAYQNMSDNAQQGLGAALAAACEAPRGGGQGGQGPAAAYAAAGGPPVLNLAKVCLAELVLAGRRIVASVRHAATCCSARSAVVLIPSGLALSSA